MKTANITIWLSILLWIGGAPVRPAHVQAFPNICPAPAHWVNVGAAIMCQCPNGIFLGLGQTCPAAPIVDQPQPGFQEYLQHWNVCFAAPSDAELEAAIAACNQALTYNRATAVDRNRLITRRANLQQWLGERTAFQLQWNRCFASAQTEADAVNAATSCDQALTYSRMVSVDHDNLVRQREMLANKIAQLSQQAEEREARERYLQLQQACYNDDVDACSSALRSPFAANETDQESLKSALKTAQWYQEGVAACKNGSARSCDLIWESLAFTFSKPPDTQQSIERWRERAPLLSRVIADVLFAGDTVLFLVPMSTIIVSSVGGLLVLILVGMLWHQRRRNKAKFAARPQLNTYSDASAAAQPATHSAPNGQGAAKRAAQTPGAERPSSPVTPEAASIIPKRSTIPLRARSAVSTAIDRDAIKQAFRERRVEFEL